MTENSRYYDKSTANDARIRIFIVYKCTKTSSRTSLILNTPPCTTSSRHYDLLSNTGRHSIASAPRYERVCSLLRTNQLPDTTASAPRGGRACSQIRSRLGAETVASRPVCAERHRSLMEREWFHLTHLPFSGTCQPCVSEKQESGKSAAERMAADLPDSFCISEMSQ